MHIKNPKVKKLLEIYRPISLLDKVRSTLSWDLNVNLPPKGAENRANQSALLADIVVERWKNPELKQLLGDLGSDKTLTLKEKAIVRNLNRNAKYYFKIPKEIIIEKEKTTSEAYTVWQEAKLKNKAEIFLPYLAKIIELDQIIAGHLGYKDNPYDALLDLFEPGLTAKFTQEKFSFVQTELAKTLKRIQASKKYISPLELVSSDKNYPADLQKNLALFMVKKSGFDMEAGRVDISTHPFTTSLSKTDVRFTNFYKLSDFRDSYTSSMHEVGHAIYEQGVSDEYSETPLEGGVSLGIHEGMSRFWENQVGRNPKLLEFLLPTFQAFYPDQLSKIGEETLVKLLNWVAPSLIRIEADEVSYSLHIILRFELENALMNKKLKPKDIPEAWRAKMKKLLGVVPKTNSEGFLQDVHWSMGVMGYFPSYALGNLYASQFLSELKNELDFDDLLAKGDLGTIRFWMKEQVYQHGSLYWPQDLIKKATGEELNPKYFVDYINNKYSQIY